MANIWWRSGHDADVTTASVPVLSGKLVRLEPLGREHLEDLVASVAGDRSTFGFATVPDGPGAVAAYVEQRLVRARAGELVPFAQVRLADRRAVGSTSFGNLRRRAPGEALYAVEVGGRWQPSQVAGEEDRLRDTAMYSVVDDEWPSVRDHLRSRLAMAAMPR